MKRLKFISAVAIVLATATMLYLAKARAAAPPDPDPCAQGTTTSQPCVVTITPNPSSANGSPTVKPPVAYISKDENQEVEWQCAGGCQFTVVFTNEKRKPFDNRVFDNAHAKSGPPIGTKNPSAPYKYSVIVNEKGVKDPQIVIH